MLNHAHTSTTTTAANIAAAAAATATAVATKPSDATATGMQCASHGPGSVLQASVVACGLRSYETRHRALLTLRICTTATLETCGWWAAAANKVGAVFRCSGAREKSLRLVRGKCGGKNTRWNHCGSFRFPVDCVCACLMHRKRDKFTNCCQLIKSLTYDFL